MSVQHDIYFCDGGAEIKEAISASEEPLLPLSDHILGNLCVKELNMASLWLRCAARDWYRVEYARRWNETAKDGGEPVDVILCPAGQGVASMPNTTTTGPYTAIWNLLDYPAAVFPVADTVSVEKDGAGWRNVDTPGEWEIHGAEGFSNAPLGLQLVARRHDDEKLLAALEIVMKEAGLPTQVQDRSPAA